MSINSLQDILPLVEHPSTYLGTEVNSIRKDPKSVKLRFALAFPDLYEIGMSHFGLQILYFILNAQKEIAAERAFAPRVDMERYLRSEKIPLCSLETHTPLGDFDIIGFSLLYELNYTNILNMLDLAGIPFFSHERDGSHPFIIAGGPCTCNPEPVADFFDAMVIGDAEELILKMVHAWLQWKDSACTDRNALLREWSKLEGVYVPGFFKWYLGSDGFQRLKPIYPEYHTVTRAIVADLDKAPFPDSPIVPYDKPVHDRLRLEVARGCSRGCRFCQAGMIYRPVRERSAPTILAQSERSCVSTGYGNLSLLSLSTGDYSGIIPLMERLIYRGKTHRIAVNLPSLRAETLTPKIMELIKKIRKTGFTIAPEAGSQRLRNVINKSITEDDIHKTVEIAFKMGWQVIKLYFMVGLPTESKADIEELIALVKRLRKIRPSNGHRGKLNISVAAFIPKAHTPFQWEPQISLPEAKEKLAWIKQELNISGVQLKWQNPETSILEGLFSRGDRRLSLLLVKAYENGCRFDGWSDKFRFHTWQTAIEKTAVDMEFFTTRTRKLEEPLPWDHIDIKVNKAFLKREWKRALKGELTADCRFSECQGCGVCDFETLKPVSFYPIEAFAGQGADRGDNRHAVYRQLEIWYSKMGQAKFFGHLELKNIILRAVRRARIAVKYSEGFHPLPKISFNDPLPVGLESESEVFYMSVLDTISPEEIKTRLNKQLPGGLCIKTCRLSSSKSSRKKTTVSTYRVVLKDGFFDKKRINFFVDSVQWVYERKNRKGKIQRTDLKKIITGIDLISPKILKLRIRPDAGKLVRPAEVIAQIFKLPETIIKQATVVKVCTKNLSSM
ncbi:MAG: TIGR03960 family B12-binding radical SAM protein [Deltaproteobacteria bacterium]|nr:TIGR03960 family B12-binding radical SAM protein [Deltaproteobacteria bacterium]MBW1962692.1 TIGR03960 family B12-binding radical SAM protein [Deltaproteobacteria bacterium]MBW2153029.1 TIGR03960 family B12-binding radical SAM protein [Deltaproteobacteria bacterium]